MNTTELLRPSDLALASYGSPLRKPVIGWALAAALLALIIFSLTQLVPFFRSSNSQYVRVLLTALAVTGAITLIPVLLLRWLNRREPEPWLFYFLAFAWGGLIATGIAGDVNTGIDKVLGGFLGGILAAPFIEEAAKGLGLLVFVLLLRNEVGSPSVTPEEYTQIEGRCEPPRKDKTVREIFVAQCNLAKRKFRLHLHDRPVDDDPVVQAWRQDLQQLRRPMLA